MADADRQAEERAAQVRCAETVTLLLAEDGATPLHMAASTECAQVVCLRPLLPFSLLLHCMPLQALISWQMHCLLPQSYRCTCCCSAILHV